MSARESSSDVSIKADLNFETIQRFEFEVVVVIEVWSDVNNRAMA